MAMVVGRPEAPQMRAEVGDELRKRNGEKAVPALAGVGRAREGPEEFDHRRAAVTLGEAVHRQERLTVRHRRAKAARPPPPLLAAVECVEAGKQGGRDRPVDDGAGDLGPPIEIGRASCRERVETSGGAGTWKERKTDDRAVERAVETPTHT